MSVEILVENTHNYSKYEEILYALSKTSKKLRDQIIKLIKKKTIDPCVIDEIVGRWMVRHGSALVKRTHFGDINYELSRMAICSSTCADPPRFPFLLAVVPLQNPHVWMHILCHASSPSIRNSSRIPSAILFKDFLGRNRLYAEKRLEKFLCGASGALALASFTREHDILFARSRHSEKLREFGITDLIERHEEFELAQLLAIQNKEHFARFSPKVLWYLKIEPEMPLETFLEMANQKMSMKRYFSDEFIYALLKAGLSSDNMAKYLVLENGKKLEHAVKKGFRPNDAFFTKLIALAKARRVIEMLKYRFGLARYIRCMPESSASLAKKRVKLSECPYDRLSPEDALKVLFMYRDWPLDSDIIRLRRIASALDENKKQEESSAKRRKLN